MKLLANLPSFVRVVEVGPRDGLQNEKVTIPTAQKIQFINLLADAGLPVVEATSFVSPRAIPQLSDASEVMAGITRLPTTNYPVARAKYQGYAASSWRLECVPLLSSQPPVKVLRATTSTPRLPKAWQTSNPSLILAQREGIPVRGYISTVFGCPYEGDSRPTESAWKWRRRCWRWASANFHSVIPSELPPQIR